jgi:hypothetical protein
MRKNLLNLQKIIPLQDVEKIKRVVEVDTLYISCKKKHCEEVHTTKDTLK